MIHRGPIPAPIHGAQRITERLVTTDRRRRRRGDEERGRRGVRWDGKRGVVCRDEGVKVERGGIGFAVRFVGGARRDVARALLGFTGTGLGRGRRIGCVVPSSRQNARVSRGSGWNKDGWERTAGTFSQVLFSRLSTRHGRP
jgi:hypothetical protein